MSCTVTSASSNSGSDWEDITMPAQLLTLTVRPEGGSWTVEKLQLAINEILSELYETIDISSYSEIKYCILDGVDTGGENTSCYGYMDQDLVESSISRFIDFYNEHANTTHMSVGVGGLRLVDARYFTPLNFEFTNTSSSKVLKLTCYLCSAISPFRCIVLKGRK